MSQIALKRTIPASRGRIWQVIADLQNVHLFNPFVEEADIIGNKNRGVGAERVCYLYNGTEVVDRVAQWHEGSSLTFEILESPLPLTTGRLSIRVSPLDQHRAWVGLEFNYEVKGGIFGRLLDLISLRASLKTIFERILHGLELHACADVHVGSNGEAQGVSAGRTLRTPRTAGRTSEAVA